MTKEKAIRFPLYLVIALFLWCPPPCSAGSILSVQPISFGNIVHVPAGDLVEIDASEGTAVPRAYGSGQSLINSGNSGVIKIFSDTPGETITFIFPASVGVRGGGATHFIDGFASRSTASPVVSTGVGTLNFHIGGLLHIQRGQPDSTFNFDISVTVQFDNP